MKKFLSYEHTFTKDEIEQVLLDHLHKKLMKEDKDYKESIIASPDFTYRFDKDQKPEIDLVIICDHIKMTKP